MPWTTAHQASLSITNSWSLLKLISIELVMPPNHLILCCPLLLLPSIFPSIRVFSNESALRIRWPKYCSFSFSISPSNEHLGLISFRMDWLDLLAVQGTLKSLLQHHSSKTSILRCSAFFRVQFSHTYMTTGKTVALTRRTFFGKVMSLLFNMQSRLVIIFLPRSKHLLISWLQSPSAVILEPKKIKSATVSLSICHEVMGPGHGICISEVIDISPSNLDSSLCFILAGISHDVLCWLSLVHLRNCSKYIIILWTRMCYHIIWHWLSERSYCNGTICLQLSLSILKLKPLLLENKITIRGNFKGKFHSLAWISSTR